MKVEDLKEGKKYKYTSGRKSEKVTYKYEKDGKWFFFNINAKNTVGALLLSVDGVERNIKEVKS